MSQTRPKSNPESTYSTPRWVKAFGIIALILLLMIGVMLISGGEHGPGRHFMLGAADGETAASSSTGTQPLANSDLGIPTSSVDHGE